ncbi:hypothetical protein GC169_12110 [bacterium]|nr:hypothetical protein [bacterium]
MIRTWALAGALAALTAGCATAGGGAAEPASTAGLECRTSTPTGSTIPKRTCRSPEAWAATDAEASKGVEEIDRQLRSATGTTQPN